MHRTTDGRQHELRTGDVLGFLRDDSGQNLIEYALIAGLIGLAAVVSMTSLRTAIASVFNKLGNVLTNAL